MASWIFGPANRQKQGSATPAYSVSKVCALFTSTTLHWPAVSLTKRIVPTSFRTATHWPDDFAHSWSRRGNFWSRIVPVGATQVLYYKVCVHAFIPLLGLGLNMLQNTRDTAIITQRKCLYLAAAILILLEELGRKQHKKKKKKNRTRKARRVWVSKLLARMVNWYRWSTLA